MLALQHSSSHHPDIYGQLVDIMRWFWEGQDNPPPHHPGKGIKPHPLSATSFKALSLAPTQKLKWMRPLSQQLLVIGEKNKTGFHAILHSMQK